MLRVRSRRQSLHGNVQRCNDRALGILVQCVLKARSYHDNDDDKDDDDEY